MSITDMINIAIQENCRDKKHRFIIPNFYLGRWECDVFSLLQNGFTYEYEIKVSKIDFKKDFTKTNGSYKKHRLIEEGHRTNRFYYVCPADLISIEEVPKYVGLIYFNGKRLNLIKEAPIIHRNKDLSKSTWEEMASRLYYRWYDLYLKNKRNPFLALKLRNVKIGEQYYDNQFGLSTKHLGNEMFNEYELNKIVYQIK